MSAPPPPPSLDPTQNGWELKASVLQPVYLIEGQSVVPEELLNLTSCGCKTACRSALCCCTKFSLACTDFCRCMGGVGCENPMKVDEHVESDDSGSDQGDNVDE